MLQPNFRAKEFKDSIGEWRVQQRSNVRKAEKDPEHPDLGQLLSTRLSSSTLLHNKLIKVINQSSFGEILQDGLRREEKEKYQMQNDLYQCECDIHDLNNVVHFIRNVTQNGEMSQMNMAIKVPQNPTGDIGNKLYMS